MRKKQTPQFTKIMSYSQNAICIILLSVFTLNTALGQKNSTAHSDRLYSIDVVPNKATAIKIAESLWFPVFGKSIYNCKPFVAELINNEYWEVKGSLHTDSGGVPVIRLRKDDCRVLDIYHTK